MSTYIGLTLGSVFLSVMHFSFTAVSEPQESSYKVELRVMLKRCVERGDNNCDAIQRVLNRARG